MCTPWLLPIFSIYKYIMNIICKCRGTLTRYFRNMSIFSRNVLYSYTSNKCSLNRNILLIFDTSCKFYGNTFGQLSWTRYICTIAYKGLAWHPHISSKLKLDWAKSINISTRQYNKYKHKIL